MHPIRSLGLCLAVLLSTGPAGAAAAPLMVVQGVSVAVPASRTYAGSSAVLANPDRGFYHYAETHYRADGSGYTPLDVDTMTSWRTQDDVTMVYRIFYLEKFANQDSIPPVSS